MSAHDRNFPIEIPGRPAERLVLEGYRRSIAIGDRSDAHDAVDALFRDDLGTTHVGPAVGALRQLVKALGLCATCPARAAWADDEPMGPDEALMLGLISAMQHGDDEAAEACLRALTCDERCQPVAMAAATFALVLKSYGRTLLPVSPLAIRQLTAATAARCCDGPTIH